MSYKITKWISTQIYSFEKNKNIAYIFNHKSNEFIELEDFSALLWKELLKTPSKESLVEFAKKYKFENELDDFLKELIESGLIISDNEKNIYSAIDYKYNNKNINELIDFQSETTCFLSKHGFLPRLFLEMTYNCNLKCIHCFNEKDLKPQYIKFEEIKPAIDEAFELGTFYITLSGGECTLNPDFIKILEYIREKKLAFDFYTNGQALYENQQLFDKIIDLYPFRISLSLYSMNEKKHDEITGVNGSHFKTLNVIKRLKENNINVEIKCFLTKYNAKDYKDIQTFAKENNISLTIDYKLVPSPNNSNKNVRITEKQILNLLLDEKSIINIKNVQPHNINNNFKNSIICSAGRSCLLIKPNLDISVCPVFKILLGNYKTKSLKDIWLSKDANSELNKLRALRRIDLKHCFKKEECKYCDYCLAISNSVNCYLKAYKDFCRNSKIKLKAAKIAGIYNG